MSILKRDKLELAEGNIIFHSLRKEDEENIISVESRLRLEATISDDDAIAIITFLVKEFGMKVDKN